MATQNLVATPGYVPAPGATGGPIYQYFTEGVFTQNQMFINGNLSLAKWFSLFGFYSLNSAQGDTSGGAISTPGNIRADYGRTAFAIKSRLFMAGSITLPHYFQISPFMIGQTGSPYNVTTGFDENGDSFFNDRPVYAPVSLVGSSTALYPVKTLAGCGTLAFARPGTVGATTTRVPINSCTGPALFTLNFRLTKTWGFGSTQGPANTGQGDSGRSGGPGGSGSQSHSSGRSSGRGGASTGKKYNFSVGVQARNIFDNKNLSTPQSTLTSSNFGTSTQLAGGPYTTSSSLRQFSVQASFRF